jgi:murein DD-endopeptidase MepM/ murein hydrolase activator NlpD
MTHAHPRSTFARARRVATGIAVVAALAVGASQAASQVEVPTRTADRVGSAPAPAVPSAAPSAALRASTPTTVTIRLRLGSRGAAVRQLQRALRARGYRVSVDGVYGPGTRAAVRALQRRMKLRPTGVADATLLKRLRIKITTRSAASAPLASPAIPVPVGTVRRTPSARGLIMPVDGTLTSTYGPRWGRMHQGIDLAAPIGRPIAAAAAGTVVFAGWEDGYGQMVVIDHGGGITTAYAHQAAIGVSAGQSVGQGTIIGVVGNTGNSTGPHLHFEVRINGAATDPLPYL